MENQLLLRLVILLEEGATRCGIVLVFQPAINKLRLMTPHLQGQKENPREEVV